MLLISCVCVWGSFDMWLSPGQTERGYCSCDWRLSQQNVWNEKTIPRFPTNFSKLFLQEEKRQTKTLLRQRQRQGERQTERQVERQTETCLSLSKRESRVSSQFHTINIIKNDSLNVRSPSVSPPHVTPLCPSREEECWWQPAKCLQIKTRAFTQSGRWNNHSVSLNDSRFLASWRVLFRELHDVCWRMLTHDAVWWRMLTSPVSSAPMSLLLHYVL